MTHEPRAEGVYEYSVDDHVRAREIWRLIDLPDGRQHVQSMFGAGQQMLFAVDAIVPAQAGMDELRARVARDETSLLYNASFAAGAARGEIVTDGHAVPFTVPLPAGTHALTDAIAPRLTLARVIDFSSENDQTIPVTIIRLMEDGELHEPENATAKVTIIGPEEVDLLMAPVTATHVIITLPEQPLQHAWFDQAGMPVQWYWQEADEQGGQIAHLFTLTRYARHPQP